LPFRYRGSRRQSAVAQLSTLGIFEHMQNIDIFRLVLGSLMSLVTIYILIGLFPAVAQRQLTFQRRIKRGGANIVSMSRLTRAFAGLMCALFAAQVFAEAFHCSLSTLTGISSSALHFTFLLVMLIAVILAACRA
jgi:cation transporter-like permease